MNFAINSSFKMCNYGNAGFVGGKNVVSGLPLEPVSPLVGEKNEKYKTGFKGPDFV